MTSSAQFRRLSEHGQRSFSFPAATAAPAPARRRARRGRIRMVLKQIALLSLLTSLPLFGWAWHQGRLQAFAEEVDMNITEATLEAGFALERVRTEGQVRTPDEAIVEALGTMVGAPMYGMDVAAMRSRIEALPWVREAVVSRELPDTLKVWIKERQPFARWQIRGQLVLIDETAAVIPGADLKEFADLPFIVGEGAPEAALGLFAMLQSQPQLAERVVSAVRVGQRRWDLEFDNGMRLKLPEQTAGHGPAEALQAFAGMDAEKGILSMDVAVFDMRLKDRVVMKLTPEGRKQYENLDQET